MNVTDLLKEQFNSHVALREKRPGVWQLVAPLFHEDGDMIDLFLDLPSAMTVEPDHKIRITDHGLTLMRLSYSFDIDTPNKEKIFHRILSENGISENDGELVLEVPASELYPGLLQFSQAVSKICNMRYFKRRFWQACSKRCSRALFRQNLRGSNLVRESYPCRIGMT